MALLSSEKRSWLETCLDSGKATVFFRRNAPDVEAPLLRDDIDEATVNLSWGSSIPMEINDWGVLITFAVPDGPSEMRIPWSAITAIMDQHSRGKSWDYISI